MQNLQHIIITYRFNLTRQSAFEKYVNEYTLNNEIIIIIIIATEVADG